ncbi:related to small nuclear ribonucleoprotein U2B` (U2 small nuclear RNA-associated protein B`) [Ramularia collo-cygni]|uniref:Related to small nuclear ribonucleoprotein U2B` (U2 small nuclear RNA-associated protein B`) n=1 Tax=Ramularia collo-cygni TaxID=112498 RepID=A0A2D3V623_9PEZI|nr:related to small nuclear ribonucleoprotein U2B` (U2 small nuclear RNA-associated protein B`) [Ramularia collo-cygni]CZT17974.1 related to small nuclear ribonucleoprotein U2B` (U2 small nuclear RNA-associated protein B`) [Ramularia collo-cygni]
MALAAPSQRNNASQSLYIQNLPEKLQKHDLKRNLYMLFSTYGPVLDITAVKSAKMRGQAHVLFRDVQSAQLALRSCNGFEFFGREMRISYAKSRSHTLAKLTGTFVDPSTAKKAAEKEKEREGETSFPAPPGLPAPPGFGSSGLPPPPGLPMKPGMANGGLQPASAGAENAPSPAGTKRRREEDDEEGSDAPMEEEDSDAPMEEDSD